MNLNTSHALYANLKMFIGVDESNQLVDLVTPSRTFTKHANAVYGTGGLGRHAGVRYSGFSTYGWTFDTPFTAADNTGTLLVVLNAVRYLGWTPTKIAAFIGNNDSSIFAFGLPQIGGAENEGVAGVVYDAGTGSWATSAQTTTSGYTATPLMLTLARNGTTAYALHVNGETTPQVSGTALGSNQGGTYSYIGGIDANYPGDYDLVYALWFDKALSPTEISDLYATLGANNAFGLIEAPPADTTAPTLTSPTGTSTGTTTASGTVTTNEANGTLYALATINATETAATVKASANTQAITTTGSKSVSFTGLTASTTYYAHYVHRDAAGNDSTRVSSASFTTSASGDSTAPTLTGAITPSAITSSGFTISWPAGADNVAVTGYEYSTNGGSTYTDAGNVLTKAVTGLAASTAYSVTVRAYDASGNKSTPALAATVTTSAAPGVGSITTAALKNNTATTQASLSGLAVHVLLASTGALIVSKTAQTTNGSGVLSVTDAAITAGTAYLLAIVNPATGAVGITNAITAA